MYKSEVLNALTDLSSKTAWFVADLEAPIHKQKNFDRQELCDLCLTVFKVFASGTKYFLNKDLVLETVKEAVDQEALEESLKLGGTKN